MIRILLAIGCYDSKINELKKRERQKLLDYIIKTHDTYDSIISVVRVNNKESRNYVRDNNVDVCSDNNEMYKFPVSKEICVSGYDIDTQGMRKDCVYDIIGVSTAASVLTIAMSMYSRGYNIRVLTDYCFDRKGMHDEAVAIMSEYMPGSIV